MKKPFPDFLSLVVVSAALILAGCGPQNSLRNLADAAMGIEDSSDREKVVAAIGDFVQVDSLAPFFENAYGLAIFPTIAKGGLGIGGAHGTGWTFAQGDLTGVSKMTQVTVGFQAGGQAFSQIIFFRDEESYKHFTSGNFEFGAQASAVVVTVGANAQASTAGGGSAGAGSKQTKDSYRGGMAVFIHAKGGLMYEAALGGQRFRFDPI